MPRWATLWRRVSILLPPLLMVLLAGFSWWVAREASRATGAAPRAEAGPQQPDYFLRGFRTRSFDASGRLSASLGGAAMQHLPGDDTVRIDHPALRVVGAQGVVTTAEARSGISNADASNVQLLGDAVVLRQAPQQPDLSVRSQFLNIFPNRQQISSDLPSVVQRGDSQFSGASLEMDGLRGTFSMRGGVSGRLAQR